MPIGSQLTFFLDRFSVTLKPAMRAVCVAVDGMRPFRENLWSQTGHQVSGGMVMSCPFGVGGRPGLPVVTGRLLKFCTP